MKIIFTGGHFSPAYAVIKKLQDKNDILVIGRRYSFEGDDNETYEYRVCMKEQIPFVTIKAGRLQRRFTRFTIPAAARFPKGVYSALKILRKEKPDVVVTFGGYIGLSVALAASILKIPIVLHEQTQKAGLSARLIARFASVVLLSFDSSRAYFKSSNAIVVGNPIREELYEIHDFTKFHTKRPIIYITGGSAGAHFLNSIIGQILPELTANYFIVHQVGAQDTNDIKALEELANKLSAESKRNYCAKQFFSPEEVSYLLHNATLVVARSGINTVLELMALGVVSLLVPLPGGQRNEQKDNAALYASTGLGTYVLQDQLKANLLLEKMHDMIKEHASYEENKKNAFKYIHKDATEKIIEQIYLYGGRKEGRSSISEKKA